MHIQNQMQHKTKRPQHRQYLRPRDQIQNARTDSAEGKRMGKLPMCSVVAGVEVVIYFQIADKPDQQDRMSVEGDHAEVQSGDDHQHRQMEQSTNLGPFGINVGEDAKQDDGQPKRQHPIIGERSTLQSLQKRRITNTSQS